MVWTVKIDVFDVALAFCEIILVEGYFSVFEAIENQALIAQWN